MNNTELIAFVPNTGLGPRPLVRLRGFTSAPPEPSESPDGTIRSRIGFEDALDRSFFMVLVEKNYFGVNLA